MQDKSRTVRQTVEDTHRQTERHTWGSPHNVYHFIFFIFYWMRGVMANWTRGLSSLEMVCRIWTHQKAFDEFSFIGAQWEEVLLHCKHCTLSITVNLFFFLTWNHIYECNLLFSRNCHFLHDILFFVKSSVATLETPSVTVAFDGEMVSIFDGRERERERERERLWPLPTGSRRWALTGSNCH